MELPRHYIAPEFFLEKHLAARSPFAVLAMRREEVVGVLTGLHESSRTISGLPARTQICLQDADDEGAMGALVTGLLAEAGSSDLIEINSWNPIPVAEEFGFCAERIDGTVMIDLRQPLDHLFKQLKDKRRNVQHAMKNNLEFAEATEPEFSAYYKDVYSSWRQTARKKIRGAEATFEGYQARFAVNANRRLFVAKAQGKIIAGIFLRFHHLGLAEYSAGNSLDAYLHLRVNDFIQWKAIEWSHQQGLTYYSLGAAAQFHRSFGGSVIPAYHYSMDRTFLRNYTLRKNAKRLCQRLELAMPARLSRFTRLMLKKQRG